MSVGLVIVSHSSLLAAGVVELAAQMAGNVSLIPAGGTDEGGIGTSFEKVTAAIAEADSGEGVVILGDLGSAILTAETALDFLDPEQQERVRIADAPLVEGTVAAAVAAASGGDLDAVIAAAETANRAEPAVSSAPAAAAASAADEPAATVERRVMVTNKDGLHARPASKLAAEVAKYPARVTVNGVDAKSLLAVMALGVLPGSELVFRATGERALEAVTAAVALVESGFGEPPAS